MERVNVIGLNLAKDVFQVHGIGSDGKVNLPPFGRTFRWFHGRPWLRRPVFRVRSGGTLNNDHGRRLGRTRLSFAAPTGTGLVGIGPGRATEIHFVDFDDATQRVVGGHQQAQHMPHPPCRRLAHSDDFGQPHQGDALVRLQDEPQDQQPGAQRQLGRMQRSSADIPPVTARKPYGNP